MISQSCCRVMHLFLATGLVFLLIGFPATAHDGDVELSVQSSGLDRTVLTLEVHDYGKNKVTINGKEHLAPFIHGYGLVQMDKAGQPQLPAVCNSLLIPDAARMEVRVLQSEHYDIEGVNVAPYKGPITRNVDPATVPYTFGAVYGQDAWFPGDLAGLRDPYILREVRGVVVEVFPLQYHPVKKILRVYTNLIIEVTAAGTDQDNVIDRRTAFPRPSSSFERLYQNQFLNYQGNRGGAALGDPPSEDGDMLIISHGPFMSAVQPLVDWKNSIGITTTMVDVATIGNNSASIKNHITSVYNSSNLTFVLLVGDGNEVKSTNYGGSASDPYYSLMTGDSYPDLFVGRFSANSVGDVTTQVNRTIDYEQQGHDLSMGGWNTWGMGIASNQGPGHYGEYDDEHIDLIRDELLTYGFAKVDQIYDPSGTKSMVSNGLNQGRRCIHYCGHGSSTSWGSTGFSNTDVNNLQNVGTLPFVHSVACVNGNFEGGTCFAEAWMRASYSGQPAGAIACYMSTVNQSWDPPMFGQGNHAKSGKYGSAERFWMEMNWSVCGAFYGGSCCMMDLAGSAGQSEFMYWTCFGDPSLRLTSIPAMIMKITDGMPEGMQPPGLGYDMTLEIVAGQENYVPGSGTLYYRFDPADPFTTAGFTPLGGDSYGVTLPNTKPGCQPEFYFSAQGDGGTTIYRPATAPADVYTFEVCFQNVIMEEDFEANPGWTVDNYNIQTGAWELADPAGTSAQPEDDHTASGVNCYVTGKLGGGQGDDDVDGGPTVLTSTDIDLSSGDADISFYLWFYHSTNGTFEPLVVDISNDGGGKWTRALVLDSKPEWAQYTIRVSDLVTPTSQVRLRFSAEDNPNDSVVEAALDDLMVSRLDLDPSLWADAYEVSCATGGTVNFSLGAGAANANRNYLLLGSVTGTEPGVPLPGGAVLPIKWDVFTSIIMGALNSPVFANFSGTLDSLGEAVATMNTLGSVDPAAAGVDVYFAYLLTINPFYASNAITVTLTP